MTKTNDIWTAAHSALCAARWTDARAHLDTLAGRSDNRDVLSSAATYGATGQMADVLQARIEVCNRIAMR